MLKIQMLDETYILRVKQGDLVLTRRSDNKVIYYPRSDSRDLSYLSIRETMARIGKDNFVSRLLNCCRNFGLSWK